MPLICPTIIALHKLSESSSGQRIHWPLRTKISRDWKSQVPSDKLSL